MKIFDYVKNLFKKENVNVSSDIANIKDIVTIRKREDFDDYSLHLLDGYKKEYLDKLNTPVFFSGDLDVKTLEEEMKMYLELIVNLFLKEDSVFENVDSFSEELNLVIKAKKKDSYLSDILDIIKKVELRIIALEEILSSTNTFSVIKRRALKNKIENLYVLINVFRTQGEAIFIDANANIKMINNEELVKESDELVRKKKDLLERMFYMMRSNNVSFYESMSFGSIFDKIVYLEKELEIGVYKHKDVIEYIEEQLSRSYTINGSLRDIQDLELRIRVFSDYGRNLVSEELLDKLYNIKFKILTKDIVHSYDERDFKNLNYVELEKYKDIIFNKISDILTGENKVLKDLLGEEYKEYVKIIVKVLKDGENEYDWYKILTNKFLLSFLVSLESEKGIKELLKNTKQDINRYVYRGMDFEGEIFRWEEELSLETLSILMKFGTEKYDILKLCDKLLNSINEKEPTKSVYYLPEGITEIKCLDKSGVLLNYIRENCEGKVVYMPSTLKHIDGDIFGGKQFKLLFFNEGLETISHFPASDYEGMRTFIIPSTLKNIIYEKKHKKRLDYYLFELNEKSKKIEKYYFQNFYTGYENVKTLVFDNVDCYSKRNIIYFLGIFFGISYEKNIAEKYANLSRGFEDLRRVRTNLDKIIFRFASGEQLEINTKDLYKLVASNPNRFLPTGELDYYELSNLLEYLLSDKIPKLKDEQKTLRL